MRNHGFNKNVLAKWFSQVKYSNRAKFLDSNPDDTCYYQGTHQHIGLFYPLKVVFAKELLAPY